MATATATRRLAAILAADVVGYSRLMGADEEGTHERFKAHLVELVDPKIREHHGRIVKTTGDGVLAEFASVVDAVRCAGEIQRAMAERDLDLAEERRLRFRIGVNLGDVIVDGDDIYGDGVNIAARLEGLAAPGGICVSGTVRDHVGDRLPYAFEDMGEQSVKNIARPVRVYALRPEGIAGFADGKRVVRLVKFAARRRATPVDRRPALYEPQRRPGAAVFRGRDHRGSDDRSVAAREYVRDLAQYRVHLPEQADRHEADRPRVGRALCAGRQRQAIGQPGPRQRPADRCRRPTRIYGPSASIATRAICSPCKTRSRAASQSLSTWSWSRLRSPDQPRAPTRSTVFFGVVPHTESR